MMISLVSTYPLHRQKNCYNTIFECINNNNIYKVILGPGYISSNDIFTGYHSEKYILII